MKLFFSFLFLFFLFEIYFSNLRYDGYASKSKPQLTSVHPWPTSVSYQWRDVESQNTYDTSTTVVGVQQKLWTQGKMEIKALQEKKRLYLLLGKLDAPIDNLVEVMFGKKATLDSCQEKSCQLCSTTVSLQGKNKDTNRAVLKFR